MPGLRRRNAVLDLGADFFWLWSGAGANLLGLHIGALAYPLAVLWHSGSARTAGLVTFAALLPNLVAQLPAGILVDRCDRRRLMLWCDAGCAAATASVAAALATGRFWVAHVACVAFVQGSLCVIHRLAAQAVVPQVVPPAALTTALSRNEARARAASLLGQPIGSGLLVVGRALPFVSVAVAHLVSLLLLARIGTALHVDRAPVPASAAAAVRAGASWVFAQPFLRVLVLLLSASNMVFQGLTLALMALLLGSRGSAALVGAITALSGLGGVAGALSGGRWMRRLSPRALVVGSFAVWSCVTAPMALTASPAVLAVLYAVSGYVGGVLNVAGMVHILRTTPEGMLGRVGAVVTLIGLGPAGLGALGAGLLLDELGTAPVVLGLSGVMAALTLLAAVSPAIRAADGAGPELRTETDGIEKGLR